MKKLVNTSRIAITTVCLLCCIPQDAFCASLSIEKVALELSSPDAFNDFDPFLNLTDRIAFDSPNHANPFQNLANVISKSDDPLSTTKRFFELFLNHKGAHLSTLETCQLLRQNAHLISREHHDSLYLAISALESSTLSSSDSSFQNLDSMACSLDWLWNWFGLNKKDKKHKNHSKEALKVGWKEVFMFAMLVAGVVLVAIYSPAALVGAGKILIDGAKLFL
ncbi:MAG: hypothetical protein JSS32_01785 [Verrucomicrobia bacterium]|nr:hypothetical protein [Verrucomicrobiota bacterium]